MVGVLLTALALGVVQLALAVHVRNSAIDAAVEGARHAGLAGSSLDAGVERTRLLLEASLSEGFAAEVTARRIAVGTVPVIEVEVRAPLPLIGLFGFEDSLEVTGHAPLEYLED